MDDTCLIFSLSNNRLSKQGLNWIKKYCPPTTFITLTADDRGAIRIEKDENACNVVSEHTAGIRTIIKGFLLTRQLRKAGPQKVFIIQDQRNILTWVSAAMIGLLGRLSGVRDMWLINHLGVVYKASLTRLICTNILYFMFYSLHVLFGKAISAATAFIVKCMVFLVTTPLAPKEGLEIQGWQIDTSWIGECRNTVVQMNRVIRDPYTGRILSKYLEARSCPACGLSRWEFVLLTEDGFDFSRCLECGFIGADKILNHIAFTAIESAETGAMHASGVPLAQSQLSPETMKFDRNRLSDYLNRIERTVKPGRMLDIGCATGNSLIIASERGWQVMGIEQQSYRVDIAEERGLSVLCGTLEELWGHPDLEPASFSTITMWETLEHIPYPEKTLHIIKELLAPGGVVAISVDSYNSLDYRLLKEKHPACCGFGGYHGHINFFSQRTLKLLFSRLFLNPVEVSSKGEVDLELLVSYINWAWPKIGSFNYYIDRLHKNNLQEHAGNNTAEYGDISVRYPAISPRTTCATHLFQPWIANIGRRLGMGSLVFGIAQKPRF